MKNLACEIGDGSLTLVATLVESTSSDSESYRIALNGKNGKTLASKTITWPANEDAPSEINFCSTENCVKLSNGVTVAKVPIKLRSLSALQTNNIATKRYKTFTANPVSATDEQVVLNAVSDVINKPSTEKRWRQLGSAVANCDLAGVVPVYQQSLLLDVLRSAPENDLPHITSALAKSRIFGFKSIEKFYGFCIANAIFDVPLSALKENGLMTEKVLCQLLKHAVSCVPGDGMSVLQSVLSHGFAKEAMTREIPNVLSTGESSQLVDWCFVTYGDKDSTLADKALNLVSAIYDSQGSRIVWDTSVYPQLLESSGFIADMALMSTLFSSFEMKRSEIKAQVLESVTPYRVVRVKLPVRKMIW